MDKTVEVNGTVYAVEEKAWAYAKYKTLRVYKVNSKNYGLTVELRDDRTMRIMATHQHDIFHWVERDHEVFIALGKVLEEYYALV